MAFQHDDVSINTVVGLGASVSGNLKVSGFARIDGDIDGDIEATGRIMIGEKARIRGNVSALSVIVGGVVIGDIVAPEGVQLLATSSVIGDLVTKRVRVEDQVLFHGYCIALENETSFSDAQRLWQDVKAIRSKSVFTKVSD
jgi:cytoskeletal protein CcmA (bactofilin family)